SSQGDRFALPGATQAAPATATVTWWSFLEGDIEPWILRVSRRLPGGLPQRLPPGPGSALGSLMRRRHKFSARQVLASWRWPHIPGRGWDDRPTHAVCNTEPRGECLPPGKAHTGPTSPRRSVCAPAEDR